MLDNLTSTSRTNSRRLLSDLHTDNMACTCPHPTPATWPVSSLNINEQVSITQLPSCEFHLRGKEDRGPSKRYRFWWSRSQAQRQGLTLSGMCGFSLSRPTQPSASRADPQPFFLLSTSSREPDLISPFLETF